MTLYPNDRMREMVEAIKEEKGLNTVSDVYFFSIGEVYHKLFPTYAAKRGMGGDTSDPAEVARRKVEIKRAEDSERERIAVEERAQICRVNLKGEVVEDVGGAVCVFNTYNFDTPDEQRVPLEMVTLDFAKHQKITPSVTKINKKK